MIQRIKNTLPDFPDEVIETWLLPYAVSEGWPPVIGSDGVPLKRWEYLLMRMPWSEFQNLSWSKVTKHISIYEFGRPSFLSLVQIYEAAILGGNNSMSVSIPDLKQRFDSIVNYIRQNGKMPKAPILYLNDVKKYEIFDGNHRLSAYYYCYGYFNENGDSSLMLKAQEDQTYWIASGQRTITSSE
jgi:hypothetical protein